MTESKSSKNIQIKHDGKELFFDPFRGKDKKGPLMNSPSNKNLNNESPNKSGKSSGSCEKEEKRQQEADRLKMEIEERKRREQ